MAFAMLVEAIARVDLNDGDIELVGCQMAE
jgi:hypothetical protein